MTEPTTPAGRALITQCNNGHWQLWSGYPISIPGLRRAILAIEEQARAEGRREAVRQIRERLNIPREGFGQLLREVLDEVAHYGRSSDPTEETICDECGKAMDDTEIRILDKDCLHRLRRSSDPEPPRPHACCSGCTAVSHCTHGVSSRTPCPTCPHWLELHNPDGSCGCGMDCGSSSDPEPARHLDAATGTNGLVGATHSDPEPAPLMPPQHCECGRELPCFDHRAVPALQATGEPPHE